MRPVARVEHLDFDPPQQRMLGGEDFLISVAEVLDTAAERLTAASAIAAMASATSTSISVNPRDADPPNDVSVDRELLARARHRRSADPQGSAAPIRGRNEELEDLLNQQIGHVDDPTRIR